MTLRIPQLTGRLAGLTAALALLLGALGCSASQSAAPDQAPDHRLTVVASTDVWAGVARAVGGDTVEIKTIIHDPAADPHSYESTPADAVAVTRANLVVFNGGGYDDFIKQILTRTPGKPAIEAVALAGRPANEHVWYDLPTVQQVADQIAGELGRLAPAQAQQFTTGAQTFRTEVDGLHAKLSTIAGQHAGTPIAMTEPVAYHLIVAAGLEDRTPPEFTEAIEEETDPPAAAVAATRDLFTQHQVRVLIDNPQTETPGTNQVRAEAEAAGIPVVLMTETLPDKTEYLGWMSSQIDALSVALG